MIGLGNPAITLAQSFALRAAIERLTCPRKAEPDSAEIGNRKIVDIADIVQNVNGRGPFSRDPDKVIGACIHVTGVKGGFGTSARQRKVAEKHLEDGTPWCRDLVYDRDEDAVVKVAIRLRHGGQFRGWRGKKKGTPYHFIRTQQGEWLRLNHRHSRTFHGHGANRRFDGVAFDGLWADAAPDSETVEDMQAFLRAVYASSPTLTHITAHCCFSRSRWNDPGEHIWRPAVLPVAEELGLDIHNVARGGGRRIDHWSNQRAA